MDIETHIFYGQCVVFPCGFDGWVLLAQSPISPVSLVKLLCSHTAWPSQPAVPPLPHPTLLPSPPRQSLGDFFIRTQQLIARPIFTMAPPITLRTRAVCLKSHSFIVTKSVNRDSNLQMGPHLLTNFDYWHRESPWTIFKAFPSPPLHPPLPSSSHP